ncbi:hypothetical protein R3P38DRAFT_3168038 [Favolaschia claudopus]|uniref:Uncharacterized protein n=1 Tax=Favolaschia claudopus TaxID=2862362 RepID=A0AAW0E6Q6_9AGAR
MTSEASQRPRVSRRLANQPASPALPLPERRRSRPHEDEPLATVAFPLGPVDENNTNPDSDRPERSDPWGSIDGTSFAPLDARAFDSDMSPAALAAATQQMATWLAQTAPPAPLRSSPELPLFLSSPDSSGALEFPLDSASFGDSPNNGVFSLPTTSSVVSPNLPLSAASSPNSVFDPSGDDHLVQPHEQTRIVAPGGTSLAAIRARMTEAQDRLDAAVFLGVPGEQPESRNILTCGVNLPNPASLFEILDGLRRSSTAASTVLNRLLGNSPHFAIAWSKRYVEVDATGNYALPSNGYRLVGPLIDHHNSRSILVEPIAPNEQSRTALQFFGLDPEHRLFAIYISSSSSLPLPLPIRGAVGARSRSHTPAPTSRSQTPGPSSVSLGTESLRRLLKICLFLDMHYLAEGYALSRLRARKLGVAYTQIRQVLLIEGIVTHMNTFRPVFC